MDYSTYISESFTRKVSLVVMAIDDFTGKPILGSNIRVYIEGAAPAVKKNDGHHVFLNLDKPSVTVCAESGQYNPCRLECDLTAKVDKYTFLKLRLVPNRSYPIPRNTTCIEGKAAPASQVRIFCPDGSGAYKLLYDYSQEAAAENRVISIFHPDDLDLEGKLLHISDSEGGNREFLRVSGVVDKENKKYLLAKELSVSYKKIGTSLYSVYETAADKNGVFFLPVANTYKGKYLYVCEAAGEKTVSLELELESGKVNKIDLRPKGGN
ncbi:MAG TPA: hypothetical protein VN370_00610 [Desulfitobacteriaceae bacterium]|nr:hypothetical protein [Desulfitobacteriaceae bacterium]